MEEALTIRFTLDTDRAPDPAEVAAALGETVTAARRVGETYEVTFRPQSEDEADSIWLMLCEIGASFPGAVLAE